MKYLIPAETMLEKVQGIHFVRNDDIRMGIEKRSNKAMAAPGITDENTIRSDIAKEFGIPTALNQ